MHAIYITEGGGGVVPSCSPANLITFFAIAAPHSAPELNDLRRNDRRSSDAGYDNWGKRAHLGGTARPEAKFGPVPSLGINPIPAIVPFMGRSAKIFDLNLGRDHQKNFI